MAEVATVSLRDIEPVTSFIRTVTAAGEAFQEMTSEEVGALPSGAKRGLSLLQDALNALIDAGWVKLTEVGAGPRDFSAEVHSHFTGRQ